MKADIILKLQTYLLLKITKKNFKREHTHYHSYTSIKNLTH